MLFQSWLPSLQQSRRRRVRKANRRPRSFIRRAVFEPLEDRRLLAPIAIDPGGFLLDYQLDGGAPVSGEIAAELAAGPHAITVIPGVAGFNFEVDAGGNVSQASGAAVGGLNSLTFNTVDVGIDPGSYTGDYSVHYMDPTRASGPRTVTLIPGVNSYGVTVVPGVAGFNFNLDAAGNVIQTSGAAVGGLNSMTFNTANVSIDPGNYTGDYSVHYMDPTLGSGPRTVTLIPGVNSYGVTVVPGVAGFNFNLDAAGNVIQTSGAVVGGLNSMTFNTANVSIDPGNYTGDYSVDYIDPTRASGPRTVTFVSGVNSYSVSIMPGVSGFNFNLDAFGQPDPSSIAVTVEANNYTFLLASATSLSGRVFDDLNNDGLYNGGDTGIAGVTVELFDQSTNLSVDAQVTDTSGNYTFDGVAPGTYRLVEAQANNYLDGNETAGNLGGTVDNSQDGNVISDISIATGDPDAIDYNFAEIRSAEAVGLVWNDFNNDGEVDFGERAIPGVVVQLTGVDDRGNSVNLSTTTDVDGIYMFIDLRPSDAAGYTVSAVQPLDFEDGQDTLGTVNGILIGDNSVNDVFSELVLGPGSVAENYNFGERPHAGDEVTAGRTATIGFWQNKNGRQLIAALNGGAQAAGLSTWLSTTFVNMYGASAGPSDLTGMTNVEVADFYSALFRRKKKEAIQLGLGGPTKMDAQVMATAFSVYVTNQTLAGTTASGYGFVVTADGVGIDTINVGDGGAAFDVADNTQVAVLDLLFAVNDHALQGVLYDEDADGDADDGFETLMRTMANDVFAALNEQGDI